MDPGGPAFVQAYVFGGIVLLAGMLAPIVMCCKVPGKWPRYSAAAASGLSIAFGIPLVVAFVSIVREVVELLEFPETLRSDLESVAACVDDPNVNISNIISDAEGDLDLLDDVEDRLGMSIVTAAALVLVDTFISPAAVLLLSALIPCRCGSKADPAPIVVNRCCIGFSSFFLGITAAVMVAFAFLGGPSCDALDEDVIDELPDEIKYIIGEDTILQEPPWIDDLLGTVCGDDVSLQKYFEPGVVKDEYDAILDAACKQIPVWSAVSGGFAAAALFAVWSSLCLSTKSGYKALGVQLAM